MQDKTKYNMKISQDSIIEAYSKAVRSQVESRKKNFESLRLIANSPTSIHSQVICPNCRQTYLKTSANKTTCSNSCKLNFYENLSVTALKMVCPTPYTLAKALLSIQSKIDTYIFISKLPVGRTFSCPTCSASVYKKTYQKAFCSVACKDRFWNLVNTNRLMRAKTRIYK